MLWFLIEKGVSVINTGAICTVEMLLSGRYQALRAELLRVQVFDIGCLLQGGYLGIGENSRITGAASW